ncbi:MAG: ABC transporter permease [Terriglobia bacterium]|jgi:putative ABC transport system permease protein
MTRRFYKLRLRFRSLFKRGRVEQELSDELRFHLENLTQEYVANGLTPEEACYAALRELGAVDQIKEECRDMRRINFIDNLIQDVRYGARTLRRNRGFAAVAIVTLALGIGANTAIFSVVNTVLLRPLPFKDPSSLVWATERFQLSRGAAVVISPDFIGWKERNQVFDEIGAFNQTVGANLTAAGEPARVSVMRVTAELFPMLGVRPIRGRTFLPAESKQAQRRVALLNEALWRSRFGSDPHILGKSVRLDDDTFTVVGILPANLRFPAADVWIPLALDSDVFSPHSPHWTALTVIARLKPGVAAARAQSDLQLITERLDREYPKEAAPFRAHELVEVIPLHQLLVQNVRPLLLILLGVAAFVLLIACANVANLLLSRGVLRGREMAVRAALGARRLRIVRQLLTEGLLLALAGGVLGLLAGLWGTTILRQLIPSNLSQDIHLDLRVLAFSAGIAVLAVLVFGFVPAFIASRTDVGEALKEGGAQAGARPAAQRLRALLAAGEIALSLILLVGAGLLARSFLRLSQVELGFDPHGVLMATVERPWTSNPNPRQFAAFFQDALERVRSLPGVKEAAVTTRYPFEDSHNTTLMLKIRGVENFRPPQPVPTSAVSPDYFRVMRIPSVKGRTFADSDAGTAPSVVIVNEAFARMAFKAGDPLAQQISFGPPPAPWSQVVGVVADTRDHALAEEPIPEIYVPYLQQPSFSMALVLRTAARPQGLVSPVRKAVESIDKNQPLSETTTMEEVIAGSVAPHRFQMMLLGLFALLALVLAAVGVYGVVSYSCSLRVHEFGVRMALGAERRDLLGLVIRQGAKLALIGVSVGLGDALALTRFLSSMLYAIKPTDPLTLAAVSMLLAAVALLASYIPARRATKVDPMVALRYE